MTKRLKPELTSRAGRRSRIALFGVFGGGNFGNEASLQAMVIQLRQRLPEAELCCICVNPAQVERDYGLRSVGMRSPELAIRHPLGKLIKRLATTVAWRLGWMHFGRAVRALWHTRGLDLLVFPGTGVLDDFATDPWMWPYDVLIWSAAARVNGVKVLAVSIGAGPIRHPLSKLFMKAAARLWDQCSCRNESSNAFMKGLGMQNEKIRIYPDLVFSLPLDGSGGSRPDENARRITVGVGLMAYFGWGNDAIQGRRIYEQYIEKISSFVVWLLERDCEVHLVTGEWCDRKAVEDVLQVPAVAEAGENGRVTGASMKSFQDLAKEMETVDIVVATRFHNVVCALMLGKPTISLGYAEKNSELLQEFGLEAYSQHVESFDTSRLKADFEQIAKDLGIHRGRILAKRATYQELLGGQYESLAELVSGGEAKAERRFTNDGFQGGEPVLQRGPRNEYTAIGRR